MKALADLHDALARTPQRGGKLRLIVDFLARAPDPERGWGIAALAGSLDLPRLRPADLREIAESRLDPVLFGLSLDHVGDLAETLSLIWPEATNPSQAPGIRDIVSIPQHLSGEQLRARFSAWLDNITISQRYLLLKLLCGGLKVGVSAALVRMALARYGGRPVEEVEALWHDLTPPYRGLLRWLDGAAPAPQIDTSLAFRPLMRARPLDDDSLAAMDPVQYAAEWRWDGIRALLVARGGLTRLYTRNGDEIGGAFPDLIEAVDFDAVLDGELLVARRGAVAPLADLQKRLGRKTAPARIRQSFPAHLRLFDILVEAETDLRGEPFDVRRRRLEAWFGHTLPTRMDLSPLVPFEEWKDLAVRLAEAPATGSRALVLKRRDEAYPSDRAAEQWLVWRRPPLHCDCVLMYAERGHDAAFTSYTVGCWRQQELVPVGKVDGNIGDAMRAEIDRWIAENALERYGPVLAVAPALVCEVAFDAVDLSPRHKAGLTMRLPRIRRLHRDKVAAEAGHLETLRRLAG